MIKAHALGLLTLVGISFPSICHGSEVEQRQIGTILSFYQTLTHREMPTGEDFVRLFGYQSELEFYAILRDKFPNLERNEPVENHPEASSYIKEQFDNRSAVTSKFLQCVKKVEPALFASNATRQLHFPPKVTEHSRRYTVVTKGKSVTFTFSATSETIDEVVLPNGQVISSLLDRCYTKRKK